MANKAAIDFGNSNTVLAEWDELNGEAKVLNVPEFSQPGSFLIPSLISYEPDGRFFVGEQTRSKASPESKLFRWMKRYISLRSPYSLRIGEKRIDARQAAGDFLNTLTAASFSGSGAHPDELVISIPVESFEHYSEWLLSEMHAPENMHVRLVDEAAAAAAGYGLSLHPGNTLLVVDFGGSTLQAVCVSVMENEDKNGRSCRVLGKAGCGLGGMTLDRWIYEEALKRLRLSEYDPMLRRCSGELLSYCEQFKMRLSEYEASAFDFFPDRSFSFTRIEADRLFREHGLFSALDTVLSEAVRSAEDRGFVPEELTAVLPVGGSCLVPSVREYIENRFSPESTVSGEPLGAAARGAAVIAGGMRIFDFIQHNYAIRYTDPTSGTYRFHTIIPKGTKYPERRITSGMRLKASYEGQNRFGIAIYELREDASKAETSSEIFFDLDGSVRVMPLTEEESRSEQLFWMNERNPLFLNSDTPGEKGVPRFEVSFGIDSNKMLTVTAVDLLSQTPVLTDHPVVQLI